MTVKTRITLYIVGTGLVASLLFSVVVFLELIEQPFRLLDDILKEEAHRITRMILEGQSESKMGVIDSSFYGMDAYWIEIYDQDANKTLYQSSLAKSVKLPKVTPGSRSIASSVLPPGQTNPDLRGARKKTFRIRTFLIQINAKAYIVQIARPMDKLEEEIWELILGIVSGLIFSSMALIAISRFITGKILQPIGEMKELAQEISEKNLELRIPVEEGRDEFSKLAATINKMLDRLQHSFTKQKSFLFDTSHELKTPLTTMRLAIDEISAYDWNDLPSFVKDNLLRINNRVLRMERLVKDLLNLSSLEMMIGAEPKPVNINELLLSLVEEYEFLSDAHNIKIDIRFNKQCIVLGDAEKLYRAFSNILDNAIKYNVEGGRIDLTCDESSAWFTVTVSNTGSIIPEDEIPKLFDQFYRVEKSRSIQHGGSGLGLAIVKKIIELHDGKVKFESLPEAWNRVTVSLPKNRRKISQEKSQDFND
ncbi:MAG: HAMP domain-containing histidine kinase [Candidatus Omnitrophica bacterium]|nr:HAMP domain-containing histidine kinase [Candidatus Omnitrophota bacterium]